MNNKMIEIKSEQLKIFIREHRFTQKEFAHDVLNTSENYLARRMSKGIISKLWIFQIANYFEISLNSLTEYLTGEVVRL